MSNSSAVPGNSKSLLLTPAEAMTELRYSRATLFKLLKDGELDSFKEGGSRRITRVSVEAYIERRLAREHEESGHGENPSASAA